MITLFLRMITALSLFVFLLLSLNCFGQGRSDSKNIAFGIQAGINASAMGPKTDNYYHIQGLLGINAGGFAEFWNNRQLSFKPGILYSMMGNVTYTETSRERKRINYISVPLLAKLKIESGEFNFFAGPQISFLTSAKHRRLNKWTDMHDRVENNDISGIIGLGAEPKGTHMGFSLDFQLGFKKVFKTAVDGSELKYRAVRLLIYLKI